MDPVKPSTAKRMTLRYSGACCICGVELAARQEAIYERAGKTVRCVECPPAGGFDGPAPGEVEARLEPATRGSGVAGASAQREYDRRKTKLEVQTRGRHPILGGLILALREDPQSTRAWASGAKGEAVLGARLDRQASESLAVLHDRGIPGTKANIDHIVVTGAGVFVVDAKRYVDQRPEQRIEGGILRPRVDKLMVGGRDRTRLVDGVVGQVERVRAALGDPVDVWGVLCFVDADWPLVGAFFSIRGVRVVSPRKLSKLLDEASGGTDVRGVRDRLARAFPEA
jgi:hypothetical protein